MIILSLSLWIIILVSSPTMLRIVVDQLVGPGSPVSIRVYQCLQSPLGIRGFGYAHYFVNDAANPVSTLFPAILFSSRF